MRAWVIIGLLLLLPGVYLGFKDYEKYQGNPGAGYHISTIGEVWLEHDRPGFMEFRATYRTREQEWETRIRPILGWQAMPFALIPPVLYYIWLIVCWLLGRGPFYDYSTFSIQTSKHGSGFSRSSAQERGGRFQYRRR